jgi:hypothetical protein
VLRRFEQNAYVYFNVDGEMLKLLNPRLISFQLAEWLTNGKIKILTKNK